MPNSGPSKYPFELMQCRLLSSGVTMQRREFITLSKVLTGATPPPAATIVRKKAFDAFWSDSKKASV